MACAATVFGGCSEMAQLPVDAGTGASPELPSPTQTLIPTINVAKATGWPAGAGPTPAAGLAVKRYAENLDHPRWLYVLPNGDVLVAETNAPPRPQEGGGIRGALVDDPFDHGRKGLDLHATIDRDHLDRAARCRVLRRVA